MKKFWNWIKNSDDTRTLRLEGPIDEESFWGDEITPQMFRDELNAGEGDVTVWINSPGGNVFAASEIYTMLRDYKGIYDVARDEFGFAVLDGWTVGLSPKNAKVKAEYIVDGVHPNPIGHELIGASLARMLNAI